MTNVKISDALGDLIKSGKDLTVDGEGAVTFSVFEVEEKALGLTDDAKTILRKKAFSTAEQFNEQVGPAKNKYYEDGSNLGPLLKLLEQLDAIEPTDIMLECGPKYIRRVALANYFGVKCLPADVSKAVSVIGKLINDVVADGAVHCTLSKPIILPLANGELIIATYLNIRDDKQYLVEQKYKNFTFQEGEVPADL